ncbi:MAG: putative beta-lysine N-acetyltransferase [Methanoregula sp.]|jgi:putative beta-lysine N-acetyltransferase|uniref:putative beta-lysine N-acetyltransferase n=1 Tax=Methanoregula sp. TaxID=2052170 RepID=UPI0025EE0A04|nr:putative beta-lysine N-acetyltransferase [Methanoregula sp.]MCK9632010.1 putative beta-lysine N-acetyltransferase [Methanoregula sp.]
MTQNDVVLRRGKSVIQHGHFNNRVYVMKLAPEDIPDIIRYADDLAHKEGYSKIFVKVPVSVAGVFARDGYITEATVPFFFHGKEPGAFMAKYLDPTRKVVPDESNIADALSAALGHAGERSSHTLPDGFSLMHAHADDVGDIASIYRNVFKTYPFPITDPDYIRKTMQGSIRYYVIKKSPLLCAVASCEIDAENRNAEVTDFATGPLFRGRGFAGLLLHAMETGMKEEGIELAYTICRAGFGPINTVFAEAGYQHGGMLPNNTNICGSVESMNVWYKKL